MTTATPSTTLATIQPAFTDPERLALAGFLAGHLAGGLPVYLRQFTTWCRARSLALFAVRRRHRKLRQGTRGQGPRPRDRHPPAVHHRRVLQERGRRGPPGSLPGRPRPPSPGGL